MTESMIEKLGRVVSHKAHGYPRFSLGVVSNPQQVARAVLQALREPDEGMVEAGKAMIQATRDHDTSGEVIAWHAFTAMIDHILNESASSANPT